MENNRINNRPIQDEGTLQSILKGKSIVDQRLEGQANPEFWKKDLTDDDYLRIGTEGTKDIGQRSTLKEAASAVARGVPALGKLAGHALKTLDPEGGVAIAERIGQKLISASEEMEATGIMKPDITEKGFVRRGIMGGLESAIPSLIPSLGGAAAGAAIGSIVPGIGTVIGGFIGGTATTLGIHGLGTYGQEKEQYLKQGIDEKTAQSAAIQKGLIEGGLETVSNLIGMITFGWGKIATQPLKTSAKELLRTPIKTFAKQLTKNTLLNEVPMEMVQGALGSKIDENIGLLPEGAWQEAAVESIIPAITMSVLFGTGAQGLTNLQRGQVKKQLNSEHPEERIKAAEFVAKNIDDKELRKGWTDMVTPLITSGESIDINADFTQTIQEEAKKPETAKDIILDEAEKGATAKDILTKEPEIEPGVVPEETLAAEEAAAGITEEALAAVEPEEEPVTPPEKEVTPAWIDSLADKDVSVRMENLEKTKKEKGLSKKQERNLAILQQEQIDRGIAPIKKEVEDAERIRREAEETGKREELERREKEGIRIRDVEKYRVEAEKKKADEDKKLEIKKLEEAKKVEVKKAAEVEPAKKVGQAQAIMGVDAVVADVQRKDGIDYELYKAKDAEDKRGLLRIYDSESGEVVGVKRFPTLEQAQAEYNKAIGKKVPAKKETEPIPEVGAVSPRLVERKKSVKQQIENLKNRIEQAEKTAIPGTFVTGRENVPRSRIRSLEKQLDKRIDSAVEYEKLRKELIQIEAEIKTQEEAPRRELVKEKVKAKLEEQFDAIKAGDQIDVGGNNLLLVVKKNPKSVKTETGGSWKADEIIKVIPKAAPKVELPTEFEGIDLSKITVEVFAIREKTGETIKVRRQADAAMETIDKDIETYYSLLNCISV